MRPETIFELVSVIVWGLIAIFCSIAVRLEWFTHTTFFSVLAASSGAIGIIFGIRHYFRLKPYFINITGDKWQIAKTPIQSNKDVFVFVSQKEHKKGINPRIEFGSDTIYDYNKLLIYDISEKGDIRIYHIPNKFLYPNWVAECRARITA